MQYNFTHSSTQAFNHKCNSWWGYMHIHIHILPPLHSYLVLSTASWMKVCFACKSRTRLFYTAWLHSAPYPCQNEGLIETTCTFIAFFRLSTLLLTSEKGEIDLLVCSSSARPSQMPSKICTALHSKNPSYASNLQRLICKQLTETHMQTFGGIFKGWTSPNGAHSTSGQAPNKSCLVVRRDITASSFMWESCSCRECYVETILTFFLFLFFQKANKWVMIRWKN